MADGVEGSYEGKVGNNHPVAGAYSRKTQGNLQSRGSAAGGHPVGRVGLVEPHPYSVLLDE